METKTSRRRILKSIRRVLAWITNETRWQRPRLLRRKRRRPWTSTEEQRKLRNICSPTVQRWNGALKETMSERFTEKSTRKYVDVLPVPQFMYHCHAHTSSKKHLSKEPTQPRPSFQKSVSRERR